VQRRRKLWTEAGRAELDKLELLPYAALRRQRLLAPLDQLEAGVAALNRQVEEEVKWRPAALRLMTRPGVGPENKIHVAAGPVSRILSAGLLRQDDHSSGPSIAARLKRPTRRL
jgi:hypothetical protein